MKFPMLQLAGSGSADLKFQNQILFFLVFFGEGGAFDGAGVEYRRANGLCAQIRRQYLETVDVPGQNRRKIRRYIAGGACLCGAERADQIPDGCRPEKVPALYPSQYLF